MNPAYGLGVGITLSPLISATLIALHRAARALYRTARNHRRTR